MSPHGSLVRVNTLVAQLPALLGVLLGTLGTVLATTVADRGRWRRSQGVRWDERRLDAYAEFARVVKEIQAVSVRALADGPRGAYPAGADRDTALARLADADVRHTLAWEDVLLLGDAATVRAARTWRDAVWAVENLARGTGGDGLLADLLHRANEGRDAFYLAARDSLGVRGGSVAQSDFLRQRLDAGR
ncbi:secreted protein [Micromonospora sp. ATCC 39149]|nr:secreted protein [Micromonospora sp. ATCC 39149]